MSENKKQYKLPKEFTEKWIQYLESGKYRQTTSTMYNDKDKGFCCLGIACKAAGHNPERIKQFKTKSGKILHDLETTYIKKLYPEGCKVPKELTENEWLQEELANLNDGEYFTFKKIAEWIKENIELV